jgi:hypothetical protein
MCTFRYGLHLSSLIRCPWRSSMKEQQLTDRSLSDCRSRRPHDHTREALDGLGWNLVWRLCQSNVLSHCDGAEQKQKRRWVHQKGAGGGGSRVPRITTKISVKQWLGGAPKRDGSTASTKAEWCAARWHAWSGWTHARNPVWGELAGRAEPLVRRNT